MSVYIKIKEAQLNQQSNKPFLIISSKDNALKADAVSGGNKVTWNICMISSSKEKNIVFEIKDSQVKSYGKGQLYYSSLRSHPEKQFSQTITLDTGAKLFIDVYYTQRQNFIGEIAFYSYQHYASKGIEEIALAQQTTKAQSRQIEYGVATKATPKSKTSLFFCCGDEGDDRLFTVEQDVNPISNQSPFLKELPNKKATQGVQFYKGPCKSTNLFSCCDAGIQDQKFTVVENYYRDK